LVKLEWSCLFAPRAIEFRESGHEWWVAGLMILTVEPCPVPSPKRGF
jgi:hypothetical protein